LWDKLNHGGILGFDVGWGVFGGFTSSLVDLGEDLVESAGNMGSMAIEDWGVSGLDLSWMVKDNNLGVEGRSVQSWVILGV